MNRPVNPPSGNPELRRKLRRNDPNRQARQTIIGLAVLVLVIGTAVFIALAPEDWFYSFLRSLTNRNK
jgi:hypothetical protein